MSVKPVVVDEWINPFSNTQQLHKAVAVVCTATHTRAGCGWIQRGIQVSATLKRLDDGFSGGSGRQRTVLRGWPLLRLYDIVVKQHTLLRRNCQRLAVIHHEFNTSITCGADGFAFFQNITHPDHPADALGIDSKNGACSADGGDGCNGSHSDLRLNNVEPSLRPQHGAAYWT